MKAARTPVGAMQGPITAETIVAYGDDERDGVPHERLLDPYAASQVRDQLRKYGAVGWDMGPGPVCLSESLSSMSTGRLRRWSF